MPPCTGLSGIEMQGRKQQLLKRHRRNKRIAVLVAINIFLVIGLLAPWWSLPLLVLLAWVAHEAWFADHLFYSPDEDYHYVFAPDTPNAVARVVDGYLQLDGDLPEADTLILQWHVRCTWLGRWLDPAVRLGDDRQDFERGVAGVRYLNLSGQYQALRSGQIKLRGRLCQLASSGRVWAFANPDYTRQSMMVIAPHADDAELAAFGQYSRCADVSIVTLTQGEIEAEHFQRLGLDKAAAARLKGRLRTWDSLCVPLWGNVPISRCVQLGYYCLQLPGMAQEPDQAKASRESGETDVRLARRHNTVALPSDVDGQPTWNNLVADLIALIEHFRPQVVVTPHPQLDPHADHIAATQALETAVSRSAHKPSTLLMYANHLPDNDRWPMGLAGAGIALPPAMQALPADGLWSPCLSPAQQIDKAMALGMQHDLQVPLTLKKRIRRLIQLVLAGRRWPRSGEDEFFRKAVRRHELFWVRALR